MTVNSHTCFFVSSDSVPTSDYCTYCSDGGGRERQNRAVLVVVTQFPPFILWRQKNNPTGLEDSKTSICLVTRMKDLDMDEVERDFVPDPIVVHVQKATEPFIRVTSTNRTPMDTRG
ncbi:hypothetical protein BLNAU_5356 [Blattamonas nauphoetae]|uniref:Uncharacterized protein n=1 Tax=Blattamonas nauphoetae TaxID=2049346 RepID=A0ABQ9Y732_9EUKA|nr:hypothetical protein BLNAU_5356 [Blattamonas nauphoetae]